MFERFTADARDVVTRAYEHARRLQHGFIGPGHLLLAAAGSPTPAGDVLRENGITTAAIESVLTRAMTREPFEGIDKQALAAIGIDLDQVRASVEEALGAQARTSRRDDGSGADNRLLRRPGRPPLRFTGSAKASLEGSLREVVASRSRHLGIEHIVLALVDSDSRSVRQVLTEQGADAARLRAAVRERYRRAS
jgi:ATP-dependent Clp protease ATP-binding subunit ClpA